MTRDTALAQQAARFAAQAAEEVANVGVWTAAHGWHNVTETERRAMQAETVRKVAPWVARAQAGTLPPKVYR